MLMAVSNKIDPLSSIQQKKSKSNRLERHTAHNNMLLQHHAILPNDLFNEPRCALHHHAAHRFTMPRPVNQFRQVEVVLRSSTLCLLAHRNEPLPCNNILYTESFTPDSASGAA